jgi:hypothetical protein
MRRACGGDMLSPDADKNTPLANNSGAIGVDSDDDVVVVVFVVVVVVVVVGVGGVGTTTLTRVTFCLLFEPFAAAEGVANEAVPSCFEDTNGKVD